jgi:hypothetical protein
MMLQVGRNKSAQFRHPPYAAPLPDMPLPERPLPELRKALFRPTATLSVACVLAVIMLVGCGGGGPREVFPDVHCRSPNGKRPTKIIPRWKFDRIHELILAHVPATEEGMDFKELKAKVESDIADDEQKRLGKISWLTETVTLELETRGDLTRVPDNNTPLPKRIRRNGS